MRKGDFRFDGKNRSVTCRWVAVAWIFLASGVIAIFGSEAKISITQMTCQARTLILRLANFARMTVNDVAVGHVRVKWAFFDDHQRKVIPEQRDFLIEGENGLHIDLSSLMTQIGKECRSIRLVVEVEDLIGGGKDWRDEVLSIPELEGESTVTDRKGYSDTNNENADRYDIEPIQISEESRKNLLRNVALYCLKLQRVELNFLCREEVEETVYSPFLILNDLSSRDYQTQKNTWLYDYRLVQDKKKKKEYRTLLFLNGKERKKENARLDTNEFDYKYVIFGPIGIFGSQWQEYFDYSILGGKESAEGRIIVVEAKPKKNLPASAPRLYGKAWIDAGDFSVLRCDWNPISMTGYKRIEKKAELWHAVPLIAMSSEYGYHQKGIRFPSRYEISEEYSDVKQRRLLKSSLKVLFRDYIYFNIKLDIKEKELQ